MMIYKKSFDHQVDPPQVGRHHLDKLKDPAEGIAAVEVRRRGGRPHLLGTIQLPVVT
jgi:hypothetical protein